MQIHVGTSGWMYDHWRERFYPAGLARRRWFEYYLQVFTSVELNGTFYGTPRVEAVQRWHDQTPEHFLFAVKGNRYLTHSKQLLAIEEGLQRQQQALAPLGDKQGPVLWQFSPKWQVDIGLLRAFVGLRPPQERWCSEFRHPSGFTPAVYEVLDRHRCALVWADTPYYPFAAAATGDFLYARLHGHEALYVSKYSEGQLRWWRDLLLGEAAGRRAIFVYFDNDAQGHAPHDAWRLAQLLRGAETVPEEIPPELRPKVGEKGPAAQRPL